MNELLAAALAALLERGRFTLNITRADGGTTLELKATLDDDTKEIS